MSEREYRGSSIDSAPALFFSRGICYDFARRAADFCGTTILFARLIGVRSGENRLVDSKRIFRAKTSFNLFHGKSTSLVWEGLMRGETFIRIDATSTRGWSVGIK